MGQPLRVRRFTSDDFIQNNAAGLALTVVATMVASRFPNRAVVLFYYSLVLTQQALFNPLFHAGTTVLYGAYSPGLVTSLALFLPLWHHLTRAALGDGLLTYRGMLVATVLAGLVHAAAVAQQVYFVAT